jgi:PKD repeat protein
MSPAKAIALTATVVAIAIILLAANFITTYAQQQQQQQQTQTSQPAATRSPTLLSAKDSFRVQLPEGWVIQDMNNTGFTLAAEVLQGYGILAQLCPQEQQQSSLPSVGGSSRYIGDCQQAQEEVIHIIRYPNLGTRLGISSDDIFTVINRDTIPNAILAYHIQKLQEVGYRDIQIVNSADTTMNVDISTGQNSSRTATAVPAKLVEMTYSTALNETKSGYFILTATAATPRNLGTMTGYSIFYEGNSTATTAEATRPSVSLAPILLPASVRQVFDSFELIAASTVPLTAVITSSDTEGVAPATFDFEADVAGGLEPYTINWDFGDGSSEENDDDVEHTFDVADTYNVDLTVTDSSGRTASDSMSITVEEPPPLTSVDIISNDTEGVAPATFDFEANLTGGAEPFTYSWDFGDGSSEENDDETVEHTFDVAGTYNVDLTVTDSALQTASDSILITVEEPLLSPTPPIPEERVCDPSYPDLCISPPPPNLNCGDLISRDFEVVGSDPHGFDVDNDGIGCESGGEPEPEEPNDEEGTVGGTSPDDDAFIDDDGA